MDMVIMMRKMMVMMMMMVDTHSTPTHHCGKGAGTQPGGDNDGHGGQEDDGEDGDVSGRPFDPNPLLLLAYQGLA